MCLFCFSTDKVSRDEMKGRYGEAYAPYIDNNEMYRVTMCRAPFAEPCCWLSSMMCLPCAQVKMRHRVLNHVAPGSGWANYKCCQGYIPGFCCFRPGECGEDACPVPCMCMEAWCCPGLAVSTTSMVIRDEYSLGLDDDDIRLIRCNNCLQLLACLASCISLCVDFDGEDACVQTINLIADIVFCCTSGCMTAQVYHEVKVREKSAPQAQTMQR